ncbi:DUF1854 domain-containing protein [Hydrogenophaga sp. YM1]|uniref:cyanophycin metabolism-associated DUF1854 family protein n=2 Tax=Comamonadaceae TaxID=80864 RepID=UPI000878BDAC|nr:MULTISPECIES: DUF1854 domain-containing protein [unclassified Hydrogenophaga]MBN9370451.1 DUF1854 domain-containing protein [Hydrogenophaga sp.]QRR35465.1 DUF1854 domain-containing protein [Hydrogenophaga sp. YM1]
MTTIDWTLRRDPQGPLQLTTADGRVHAGVLPVRAFPLAAPDEGLSLVGSDGHELVWIERLSALDAATRTLIEEELAPREFMPRIQRILGVSGYATPSTWTVETERGPAQLVLKAEDDIRRLDGKRLLIQDGNGLQFLVADRFALDRISKRILNRFL